MSLVTRILLDTNVVLDYLLDREPFAEAAAVIWEAHRQGRIRAYISAITPVNIFYITRKLKDINTARSVVRYLIRELGVLSVSEITFRLAEKIKSNDYEDAVQIACAIQNSLDAIVTRNKKDYPQVLLPIYLPSELLTVLTQS